MRTIRLVRNGRARRTAPTAAQTVAGDAAVGWRVARRAGEICHRLTCISATLVSTLVLLFSGLSLALARPDAALAAPSQAAASSGPSAQAAGSSLEAAANKASQIGRKVAMSLIAVGFAIASAVLVFRRDFKEAASVFAVGLTAILLASPAGVNVLRDTVSTLFGS